jgi:hypothetical protein
VDGLVNSVSELLASILRRIGVVGQTRRRAAITSDIQLLSLLAHTTAFGAGSRSHRELQAHIEAEVRTYTGARKEPRKPEWFTVTVAAVIGAGFGYLAYRINAVAWWLTIVPWALAFIFGLTALTALLKAPEANSEVDVDPGP